MATIVRPAAEQGSPARRLQALAGVAVVGLAAGAATAMSVAHTAADDAQAWSIFRGLVVVSYVVAGVYTWWRRPGSRLGLLVAAAGLLYSIASLSASDGETAHSVGRVTLAVFVVFLVYVFLSFPHDRLTSALERRLVAFLALATAFLWLLALPLVEELPVSGPLTDCGADCPDNAFRIATAPDPVTSALRLGISVVTALALLGVAAVLAGKVRSPARLRRRLVAPLLGSVIVLAVTYAVYSLLREAGVGGIGGLKLAAATSAVAIPVAILVGQLRGRVFAATSIGQLVSRVGVGPVTPARVEALLREALGDSLLTLAVRRPGGTGYVDAHGRAIELPADGAEVAVTHVVRGGRPVAALIHDAALVDAPGITEGLAATAMMLLENAQLVEELRASRARIVASAQRERLRLERDLHDGAQQRLLGIQLKLGAARARVDDTPLGRDLAEVADDADAAAAELRAFAHGLYPTVLRERGLADALRSLARTAAIPVRIVDHGIGRCSATVEEAVYFSAREAIQNATKHGGPDVHVAVTLERRGAGALEFAVADDGSGFQPDEEGDGIGLVTMRDRLGAVGGELEVESWPGRGTTVRGFVPACRPEDETPSAA